jgi:hypothetical protein
MNFTITLDNASLSHVHASISLLGTHKGAIVGPGSMAGLARSAGLSKRVRQQRPPRRSAMGQKRDQRGAHRARRV